MSQESAEAVSVVASGPGGSPDASPVVLEESSSTPPPPFRLGNRPALTGIRALCMLVVVYFHYSSLRWPIGAWAPLGVFFVLSGFLITSMLAGEHQRTGGISLKNFYSRRALRLLPPLLLTIALLAIYALFVHVQDAGSRLWDDSAAAVFNFADYRSAFGHEPAAPFLSQCWSLAVEEQFYLVWVALLVVALKFGNRKIAYALAITGIVACTANRTWIVLTQHWGDAVAGRVYYSFDTRADALFLGCLLGLIATGGHLTDWKPWARRTLTAMALASAGVLVWLILSVSVLSRPLYLIWLPVSEIASAIVIIYFVVIPKGWGTRAMGISVFVLLGEMSYTVYLIHWPLYIAISPSTVPWGFWTINAVRIAILIPLCAASWFLMEKPLMEWRRRTLASAAQSQPPAQPNIPAPAARVATLSASPPAD